MTPRVRGSLLCWLLHHRPRKLFERGGFLEWQCDRCGGYYFTELRPLSRTGRRHGRAQS